MEEHGAPQAQSWCNGVMSQTFYLQIWYYVVFMHGAHCTHCVPRQVTSTEKQSSDSGMPFLGRGGPASIEMKDVG